ncbi:acyl-CoA dehydrogenase family protein [Mycolicibacterium mengxianglii]|uniref:acyl-CoA dehydrogenase family protein n=1 Tax=Mycolicibacterium mengxianglii TaxID=2736649 RepID=UPI0018EED6F0|nr:acyl-CoA dehydrogenase family protein [Mycolicibacterium mengxianglii]
MDFSRLELSEQDQAFLGELRAFLGAQVTDEVIRRDRETGENFDEGVHLALGAAGYLAADWTAEADGGFTAVQRRIWELEIGRAHTPWFHWGTTALVATFVARFASEELREEVLPGVLSGEIRLCLGYTEPEGGSDVATCKTKAVRDDDGSAWTVNGAKMFTSNAHNSRYVFLLTNTDPGGPKHRNLTLFLVPLATAGIEIQGIRTVDGDRTNIVYYSDVRVDDRCRIGEVNGGWTVMRAALQAEHGVAEVDSAGLQRLATMTEQALLTAEALDAVAAVAAAPDAGGRRRIEDASVAYRLGRSAARLEAALSTPGMFGRVAIAATMREIAPDMMDVLGAAAALPVETEGAAADGAAEYVFRLAGPTGIYGGTLEVFRNMIAQQVLGLPRPVYSPPR